jgi:hypothetical protein
MVRPAGYTGATQPYEYVTVWEADAIEAARCRTIASHDWTQLVDVPLFSQANERQKLRLIVVGAHGLNELRLELIADAPDGAQVPRIGGVRLHFLA